MVARRANDLVRLCYSGLSGPALQTEVVRAIHALLPVDAVFLATADPETLLFTGMLAEEPLIGVADQFLANELEPGRRQQVSVVGHGRPPRRDVGLRHARRSRWQRAISGHHRARSALATSFVPHWLPRPGAGVIYACIGPSRRTDSRRPRSVSSDA